jgi:hypothetical protein
VFILKDFKLCVLEVRILKGVTGGFCGSADCKGVRSKAAESWRRGIGFLGYTPGVLQKSAEVIDGKRVVETLFFEECGRV